MAIKNRLPLKNGVYYVPDQDILIVMVYLNSEFVEFCQKWIHSYDVSDEYPGYTAHLTPDYQMKLIYLGGL